MLHDIFPPRRFGGYAAETPRGKGSFGFTFLGLHQPRCRSLVHPRLPSFTAPRLPKSHHNRHPKPDGLHVLAYEYFVLRIDQLVHFTTRFLLAALTFQAGDLAANLFCLGFKIPQLCLQFVDLVIDILAHETVEELQQNQRA